MTEARYRGQKVVVVSPDYSDHVKFADDWLPAQPGTDGALAMAMGHVMLKEFWVDRRGAALRGLRASASPTCRCSSRSRSATARTCPGRFLMAADLGDDERARRLEAGRCSTRATGEPAVPNGSVGFRYGEEGKGRWNLRLGDLDPVLTPARPPRGGGRGRAAALRRRRRRRAAATMRRGVPAIRVGRPARHDRARPDARHLRRRARRAAGRLAGGLRRRRRVPYTPAWQEAITGVDRRLAVKVAREFARNAEVSGGRSMICMGAGTNHWFHSDETYRSFIALLLLCGCVGINGGGWAHYVGQEKIRTFAGWQTLAFALDWRRPPRQAQGTSWFYTHTEQWRYDRLRPERFASPLGSGPVRGHDGDRRARQGGADGLDAGASRSSTATRSTSPTRPTAAGRRPGRARRRRAQGRAACASRSTTRARPSSFPRVFFVWRSNLLGSSGKGQEYFLRHLLGAAHDGPLAEPLPRGRAPARGALARRDPARQARPAGQRRLPHDDDRACTRTSCCRRPPGTRSTTCR